MAQQNLNVGTTPNDGTGDPLRDGMTKVQANFTELYSALAGKVSTGAIDTDVALAANSDSKIPSQKAIKKYVDDSVAGGVAGVASFNGLTGNVVYNAGMHNRIINPSGKVWQRQSSGAAAITDVAYAFDRWYGLTQSAGVTASLVANAEDGTPSMMRLSQANASSQRFGIAQVIESANSIDLRGKAIVVSARVRMSASTTLRYAIIEWTGTADTVTKDFVSSWTNTTFTAGQFFTSTSTTITATGSTALTANTLTSISLTGTIGSTANNIAIIFWTDSAQAQNVTLDIGKVQFEVGAAATPLALRSIDDEIRLCRRYYQKSYDLATAPGAVSTFPGSITGRASGTTVNIFVPIQSMMKAPSITLYSPNTGASGKAYITSSGLDVTATSSSAGQFAFTIGVASTTDQDAYILQFSADAEI